MTNQIIIQAIRKINPNAEVSVSGGDINSIVWENGTTPIAVADIQAQLSSAEFDNAIEKLRATRDKLIAETDYIVLQDSTYTDEQIAEWVIYRQALRDITNGLTTVADVEAVVFPTKP